MRKRSRERTDSRSKNW